MRISTISYGRTLSDQDFGSFRSELTADLESGDNVQDCLNQLKVIVLANVNDQLVEARLGAVQQSLPLSSPEVKPETLEEKIDKAVEEKPAKKVAKTKKAAAKEEVKKTVKASANVAYDRTLQAHKTMFLAMASELGLRKGVTPEDKTALKQTSEFMEGQDMFEAGSTEVLDYFKKTASHQFKDFKKQLSADV